MAVSLSPIFQTDSAQIDSNGDPRSGGKLFIYNAGTSTKATSYQENTGTTPHANPIVLSSNGLPPAPIWLTQGSNYKFVLAPSGDTDPPASAILTFDNVTAINDITSVATTEWTASGMTPTYISASSFSVTGDQTSILTVNRRLKLTESGSSLYGTIIKSTYTSLTTVTVLLDSGSLTSDFTGNTFWYGIVNAANTSLPFLSRDQQCGRLVYVSATQIRLDPVDGNTIWVYTGAAGWTRRTIPSAGITGANTNVYVNGTAGQNLAANTTYYDCLFDNAGTLTHDFVTTAPAVDATSGLKIKTGDPTRLLIGMVRTNGSTPGQFQTPALVLSWYKRRGILASAALTTTRVRTETTVTELHAEIQVKFLAWAEEAVGLWFSGYAYNAISGKGNSTAITLDGVVTTVASTFAHSPGVSFADNVSLGGLANVSEGYHYATIGVYVDSGGGSSCTWYTGDTLFVLIQG